LISTHFDLQDSKTINVALEELRGYWKLWSACLLSECGLPTLRGIIVTKFYPKLEEDLRRFMLSVGSPTVLIRHDKRLESPPHPRGGFLVGQSLLLATIKHFFALDRIVAVYETADPLLNMHSVNVLFESNQEAYVEVVGPGFDASDLQRGDITPHESFSMSLTVEGEIASRRLIRRVDQKTYDESVRTRKEKIMTKLETSPTHDLARKIRMDLGILDDLDAHLRKMDSPLCRFQNYQPVSESLLRDTITKIVKSRIISRFSELTGAKFPMNFSTSLVNRGSKQVFWDIVSPALKFEGLNNR